MRSFAIPRAAARAGWTPLPLLGLLVAWSLDPACLVAGGGGDARRAEVRFPQGRRFIAEIADTPERLQRGYMFRREVGKEDAMIFVFPETGLHPFWMKNTLVPLDMIWLDEERTVIHIEPSAPPCKTDPCPTYGPPRKSRYVLEVRGGSAAREELKVGDHLLISFPDSSDGNVSGVKGPPGMIVRRSLSLTATAVRRRGWGRDVGGGQ